MGEDPEVLRWDNGRPVDFVKLALTAGESVLKPHLGVREDVSQAPLPLPKDHERKLYGTITPLKLTDNE